MRRARSRKFFYWVFSAGLWLSVVLLGMLAGAVRSDADRVGARWPFAREALLWIQDFAWYTYPLLSVLALLMQWMRQEIGAPWIWETVERALDDFRDYVFSAKKGDPEHHHRATLFKYRRWRWCLERWPWSGWLVAVARSGHTTQEQIVAFRPYKRDPDRAEGIAGRAYARRRTLLVTGLPDLETDPSPQAYEEYAKSGGVTVEWLRKNQPKARSLCGIPVEAGGQPWGVIVLDSRSERGISRRYNRVFDLFAATLSKPLERIR